MMALDADIALQLKKAGQQRSKVVLPQTGRAPEWKRTNQRI